MYMPVATPLPSTPPAISATRITMPSASLELSSTTCMTRPTTMTLETVPRPGRTRSGIHRTNTTAPRITAHRPVPMPV